MPNTARGGGISRKITNAQDRKRLKEVVQDLDVPQGMGVILRTAGESRTKAEIKRDYEYLMRLWENVRTLTLQSTAPALVYEEGSLIKRSVRDLYNKDIDEILVSGEESYREAKDFMRMLMPSHAKVVQPYRETVPIFVRNGVEAQLDKMLQPQVNLKSGGYIIINQTEALVAIDVNSGRSTREHSIEETALHTNLEAAEEVARQLRLRDLAGLIVIDFIDMEENRNNRTVEKRLKDHLKNDRARIQLGRISHFGLMEMSRQRIRASVLESTTKPCPHCGGTGHVRSDSSVALLVVRAIEEFLLKDSRSHITVRTPTTTAMYVLNHKRATLTEMEGRFGVSITIETDDSLGSQHYAIVRGAVAEKPAAATGPAAAAALLPEPEVEDEPDFEEEAEEAVGETDQRGGQHGRAEQSETGDERGDRKRRRRRRRRGGRDQEREQPGTAEAGEEDTLAAAEDGDEAPADGEDAPDEAETQGQDDRKKRRRGRRGGRRNRGEALHQATDDTTDADGPEDSGEAASADGDDAPADEAPPLAADALPEVSTSDASAAEASAATTEPGADVAAEPPKKARRAPARRKAVAAEEDAAGSEAAPAKRAPRKRTVKAKAAEAAASDASVTSEPPIELVAAIAVAAADEASSHAEQAPGLAGHAAVETASDEAAPDQSATDESAQLGTEPAETAPVEVAPSPAAPERPKKSGWWQRKGFF
jgi:ribonuclease E